MSADKFYQFGNAIHNNLIDMQDAVERLLVVDISGDALYTHYLECFPEGTNPMFRERTEHDCFCCKNFIRNLGNVVAMVNGVYRTVWDLDLDAAENIPETYRIVASRMSDYILQFDPVDIFVTSERSYGARASIEDNVTWHHFHGRVRNEHVKVNPEGHKNTLKEKAKTFANAVSKISDNAVGTVLQLLNNDQLYRADKDQHIALRMWRVAANAHRNADNPTVHGLLHDAYLPDIIISLKNTMIGSLLVDLTSEEKTLEECVLSYEAKAAPENYKRPKALVTQKQIDQALRWVEQENIGDALDRRHCTIADIPSSDMLWLGGDAHKANTNKLQSVVRGAPVKTVKRSATKATPITADVFFKQISPMTKQLQLVPKANDVSRLMTLTTTTHTNPTCIFNWGNSYAWSFNGNYTDEVKARVVTAGGSLDGDAQVSLFWNTEDDLDLHCYIDVLNEHIYHSNKAGILDVDANASVITDKPVENMVFPKLKTDMKYEFCVNNFQQRSSAPPNYRIQLAVDGQEYNYDSVRPADNYHSLLSLKCTGKKVNISVNGNELQARRVVKWGMDFDTPLPVDVVCHSPNYWESATKKKTGLKHTFFILQDCKNPDAVRGVYNEYLRPEFSTHRKVFELLADRMKSPYQDNQLSGLGFKDGDVVSLLADGRLFDVKL